MAKFPVRDYRKPINVDTVIPGGTPMGNLGNQVTPDGTPTGRVGSRDILPKSVKPSHLDTATGTGTALVYFYAGGSVLSTGSGNPAPILIEFDCFIRRVTDQVDTGTITVDAWKQDFANLPPTNDDSITGDSPFNITSDAKYENAGLDDWDIRINAGDSIYHNIDAVASATWCLLSYKLEKI